MTIARATIARVMAATSDGCADRNKRDHGDCEGDKKQLLNKPRERRGVHRSNDALRPGRTVVSTDDGGN
jgi:hypothetical protein